jgi:hypothetical protein
MGSRKVEKNVFCVQSCSGELGTVQLFGSAAKNGIRISAASGMQGYWAGVSKGMNETEFVAQGPCRFCRACDICR